jgi:hypothetical protein
VKAVPIFALALSVLLFAVALRPISALSPAFPADNDTLTYEIRGQDYVTYYNGSRFSYPIEIDLSHKIVNHTGNWYFANVSITLRQPAIMLPLNVTGARNWTAVVHYYANSGEIRRLYVPNLMNWSDLSDTFVSDLLFIPQQTIPGAIVYWTHPHGHSGEWTEIGYPAELGPSHFVGPISLSTVGMTLSSHYSYNGSIDASTDVLSSEFFGEGYWEWSLGFLTKLYFDYTRIINPSRSQNHNGTRVDITGTISLVNYTLADTPIPYVPTWTTTPAIPGFPVEAVLAGLLITLTASVVIRKRHR